MVELFDRNDLELQLIGHCLVNNDLFAHVQHTDQYVFEDWERRFIWRSMCELYTCDGRFDAEQIARMFNERPSGEHHFFCDSDGVIKVLTHALHRMDPTEVKSAEWAVSVVEQLKVK